MLLKPKTQGDDENSFSGKVWNCPPPVKSLTSRSFYQESWSRKIRGGNSSTQPSGRNQLPTACRLDSPQDGNAWLLNQILRTAVARARHQKIDQRSCPMFLERFF